MHSVCSKARQVSGCLFRYFYHHASLKIFLKLYIALILPHLTYCSSVWDPPKSSLDSTLLEKNQFFSLKICSHSWNSSYSTLLSLFDLIPTLTTLRSQAKLSLLFKILNQSIYFSHDTFIFKPPPTHSLRSYDSLALIVPFSNTYSHSNSFVSSVSSLWNSLPFDIRSSTSIKSFKQHIKLIASL